MNAQQIHVAPHNRTTRLAELGLTEEQLRRAVEIGDAQRQACTALHPAGLPGMVQWGWTTSGLREQLLPLGWRLSREGGLETVISPDDTIAIIVGMGDRGTGDEAAFLYSKYPRGPSGIIAVLENNTGQPTFNFDGRVLCAGEYGLRRQTWMLLVHSTPEEIRCELAQPRKIDERDYKIVEWFERIPLPTIQRDDGPHGGSADDEPDLDIDVKRRAG